MNGMRMYMLVAPTSCMIAISRRRANTVSRIVLAMMIAAVKHEQADHRQADPADHVGRLSAVCVTVSAA